ncbi:hypothetical protein [Acinetobacter sp.]|jgi:hypothetical protein|uniref:hypothetical protein n=1 Tax=Acinetobacter sp. TaxID=472 RepID=UPI0035B3311D
MKIEETVIDFAQLPPDEQQLQFQKIWEFDRHIFPNSTVEQLHSYVYNAAAAAVPVVQYFHQGKLIGQNIIPILRLKLGERPIFIISSRAGFLTEYCGKNRSLNSAIRAALNFKLRYPASSLWFVTTLMQPKVYTLFASRSVSFFPRAGRKMPQQHAEVLHMMQRYRPEVQIRGQGIIVHPCNMPKVTPEQLVRLRNRANSHHQFFLQHVPDYFDGMGLMCICKLDFKTMCGTIFNLAAGRYVK